MYKDRGIIKWAPFDALVGFKTNIQDMIRGKKQTGTSTFIRGSVI